MWKCRWMRWFQIQDGPLPVKSRVITPLIGVSYPSYPICKAIYGAEISPFITRPKAHLAHKVGLLSIFHGGVVFPKAADISWNPWAGFGHAPILPWIQFEQWPQRWLFAVHKGLYMIVLPSYIEIIFSNKNNDKDPVMNQPGFQVECQPRVQRFERCLWL